MVITQNGALKRDDNDQPVMGGTSSSDNATIINAAFDPVTRRLLTDSAAGSGTVTSVSVVSANGFAGTVATPTTTPAITLTTTITGVLKGNGTAISAASSSTDYAAAAYKTITVSGQTNVVASTPIDTLTLVAGAGMTITTNAGTNTVTFVASGGAATSITVGTTTITSGTTTRILYDNAGTLGEYTITGTGTVVAMQTSPTFVTDITTPVIKLSGTSNQAVFQSAGVTGTLTWTPTSTNKTITFPDRTLTVDNITTGTTTNGTGFVKGNGSAISFDSSTYITGLVVGTTTIGSGATTKVLFDNAGVLGEYTISGSGNVAMTTSPVFTTPSLGVATATSLAIGGATIGTNGLAVTGHVLVEGVTSTGATGTGKFVFDGTPTLVTPVLGVATATSLNGLTITTTTGTLTMTNAKTLAVTNTITLSGTDSTIMTFPTTTATIARTDAAQTFTGTQTFSQVITTANAIAASGNAATVPVTSRHNIVTNNSAATLTITLTTASAVNMQTVVVQILDASAAAQTITWVNTENSTVSAPTTSNGSTTLPLTVGFIYNSATSKWRCIASA